MINDRNFLNNYLSKLHAFYVFELFNENKHNVELPSGLSMRTRIILSQKYIEELSTLSENKKIIIEK